MSIHIPKSTANKINGNLMRVCSSDLARFGADLPLLVATFLLSSFHVLLAAISCVNLINFLAISCAAVRLFQIASRQAGTLKRIRRWTEKRISH